MLAPKPPPCKSAVIPILPRCRSRSRPRRRSRLHSWQRRDELDDRQGRSRHAASRQASKAFGWASDDIVVRAAEAGSGSRIDVRSASRHGRSDLGVNAARIRTYLAVLHEAEKPGN